LLGSFSFGGSGFASLIGSGFLIGSTFCLGTGCGLASYSFFFASIAASKGFIAIFVGTVGSSGF